MDQPIDRSPSDSAWRTERVRGMLGIFLVSVPTVALWYAIRFNAPVIEGMDEPVARLGFALKCASLALLFTLFMGVEAVAHERLQSPAFDPLAAYETRRLRINQRYLQNTLEQAVIFLVGLLGLTLYLEDGNQMRAVLATSVVWTLGRLAFWAGYHKSSTWRVLGAPSMLLGQLMLGYAGLRVGFDVAGNAGMGAVLGAVLLFEALLFWTTRARLEP